jgi:hypothetical protein
MSVKWSGRLRDPVWQFLGVIVTIITLVISTIVAYDLFGKSQNRSDLRITLRGKYGIVWQDPEYKNDIRVFYQDKPASTVSSLYFDLSNNGNTIIRPDDYIEPIKLTVKSSGYIVGATVDHKEPAGVDFTITKTLTDTIILSKSLLNPGDTITFRITFVDDPDPYNTPTIIPTARIAGIRELSVVLKEEPSIFSFATNGYLRIGVKQTFFLAGIMAIILFVVLLLIRRYVPNHWHSRWIEAEIVLFVLVNSMVLAWIFFFWSFVQANPTKEDWDFWLPGIFFGAITTTLYVTYILFRLKRWRTKGKTP